MNSTSIMSPLFSKCPKSSRFCHAQDDVVTLSLDAAHITKAWVELVQSCNLRCLHCNVLSFTKPFVTLSLELFLRDILPQCSALGVRELWMSGGEPTLHPQFSAFVDGAHQQGLTTTVITNATVLRPAIVDSLSACHTNVQVSIDGPDEATFDYVRGHGAFQRLTKGLDRLLENDMAHQLIVGFCLMAHNIDCVDTMVQFCLDRSIPRLIITPVKRIGAAAEPVVWNRIRIDLRRRLVAHHRIQRWRKALEGRLDIHISGEILEPDEYRLLGLEQPEIPCRMWCEEIQYDIHGQVQVCPRFETIRRKIGAPPLTVSSVTHGMEQGAISSTSPNISL